MVIVQTADASEIGDELNPVVVEIRWALGLPSNKVADIDTLLFCSKNKKGKELWDEVNKPEHDQPELSLA